MKKIFPILKYLQDDDIIIDAADDILFPKDLIESRLKDFEKSDYLYEYRDYYISLDRTRALKSQNDTMSFELEKEASKYRTTINKAIERTTLRRLVPSYLTSSRRSI